MLKSVTTVLHEVTRPKPDLESESELEDSYDSSDEYDDDSENERFLTKADALYLKISRNLSPYDAIAVPPNSELMGGNPIRILDLTDDDDRTYIEHLSKFALLSYQDKEGASYEFHDLVKCTYWVDSCTSKYVPGNNYPFDPTKYYITFKAKAKGDPSSSPKTFQAKLVVDELNRKLAEKDKPTSVEECRICTE